MAKAKVSNVSWSIVFDGLHRKQCNIVSAAILLKRNGNYSFDMKHVQLVRVCKRGRAPSVASHRDSLERHRLVGSAWVAQVCAT